MMEKIEPRFLVLMGLCQCGQANIHQLLEFTKLPVATFRRAMASLRTDFKMDIQYVRGRNPGYYVIRDWGVIDPENFSKKFLASKR